MRPFLLALLLAVPFFAQSMPPPPVQLHVTVDEGGKNPETGVVPVRVTVRNNLSEEIIFAPDIFLLNGEYEATLEGGPPFEEVRTLAGRSEVTYDYRVVFPRKAGRAILYNSLTYSVATDTTLRSIFPPNVHVSLARGFTVTSTADDGEGTLRRVITTLNADPECAELPCRIVFAIAETTANGWVTIAPLTPLPRLDAKDVEIDGTTQSDTNHAGPDVELLGTQLRTGDALEIRSEYAVVRGLAIGGFPGGGIFYRPAKFNSTFLFERNYIGVDPTGTRAVFNGQRGITVEKGVVAESVIRDNILSGNGRSGIYIDTERNQFGPLIPVIVITGNRIGVASDYVTPIGNNASGIYLGPGSEWARVENNVIAYNSHAGIALGEDGGYHMVIANRIFRNGGLGIDYGINGPGTQHLFRNSHLAASVESARYDAATNTTTVRGRLLHREWIVTTADVYVNSENDREGEQYLGSVDEASDDTFVFTITGDYRGQYITALARGADDATWRETSEFSNAVKVE